MGKLDKLKSQIPQGSQELSTKNHLAKTEIAMSFQNEGTELTRILLRNIEFNPHNLWSCNDDDESIQQLADAIHSKLFVLPDDTAVLPGHMGATTIGFEKGNNPFV